jgi:hypothetical protein
VFGGVLLIGGLVAIFNPLAGAAIAAKSLIPSLGMLASKYGLRIAEESLSQAEMKRKIQQAERDVLRQFQGSETQQHVNGILTILDRALRTNEDELEPMIELHALLQLERSAEEHRMLQLASAAVLDVFDSVLKSPRGAQKAGIGPEDLRFFQILKGVAGAD